MRHYVAAVAGCVFLLLGCDRETGAPPHSADMQTLVRQLEASTSDWNTGQLNKYLGVYDSASTFMSRAGRIGLNDLRLHYERKYFDGGRPVQTLRFDSLVVRMLGADHALITGRYELAGGGKPSAGGWFTLVWGRTREGWKILHDHTS